MPDASPSGLTQAQVQDLCRIADVMIPASTEYAVPSAGDDTIIADILRTLGRDLADVRTALTELASLSGGAFSAVDDTRREAVAATFLASRTPALVTLGRVVLQCYYRDDRVMRSLGLEPRPPFPLGHTLEQGDWSLLDPVRTRTKMWRDAP
ncbi:MAG TPA: hypothetical protein VK726_12165 [Acetobacteraceae bacterium]|jgi:hypothetical protein|nr:hypothetical protein [Acetobacteraceae bacterium]